MNGRGSDGVVVVVGLKAVQVDFVIDEVVDSVLDRAGLDLLLKGNRQKPCLFLRIVPIMCHDPLPRALYIKVAVGRESLPTA